MKEFRLAFYFLLLVLSGCKDREITNPFDADCPKEVFTPSDFKADQQGAAVQLSWKQGNTNISGFVINRNENDGTMAEVAKVDKSFTQWSDENIGMDKKYGYQLFAYAGENLSNMLVAYCTPVNKTVVVTDAVSAITSTSAVFGGSAANDNGLPITGRGVCYSANVNPTIADNKVEMGSGNGAFNLSVTGLKTGTTYYLRAYATTKQGTTYGAQVTFTTSFLTVSPISYIVPKESGSKVFTVASNIDWQVSSNQSWCTLSANSGKGNGSITALFTENKEVPQRTATITFTGSVVTSQPVSLTQAGTEPPVLTITPDNQNVTNATGTTTFAITSNVAWTATSDQTWCKISSNSGIGNTTLTINYEANTTNSQRIANLAITGLGLSAKTVTLTQQSAIPTARLVAYYPFNGNANDESGNGNHGTVNGATLTNDRKGITGKAYKFNGKDNYIKANSSNLPTANRSVSLWFNANSISNRPTLIAYGGFNCSGNWIQSINIDGNNSYCMSIHCTSNHFCSLISISPVGNWHHWVVTNDINGRKMYLDGTLVSTDPQFINDTYVTGRDISIGVSVNQNGFAPFTNVSIGWYEGLLDDICIYNRALTESEIQQLYNE